jgi:hypothetical protein
MPKFIAIAFLLMLGACSNINKQELGLANTSPDETMVETRKPLSLPPEFDIRPEVTSSQFEE